MSPAQILERSYQSLRQRLIEGAFRAGQRLEAAILAGEMHVSITPVRDVLNRLTGEGLVHAIAGDGFYVPVPDESSLRNLLYWNAHLAIQGARAGQRAMDPDQRVIAPAQDHAVRTAMLFLALARRLDNGEFAGAVMRVNDRLHAMRRFDEQVLGGTNVELAALEAVLASGHASPMIKALRQYHARRRARLATYVRLLRADPASISR